jgi:6-pyruvoyltetrahydropterin/6-carboxytetrahydropterin synthase
MYEVSVEADFSAAHRLRLADGSLEPPHGHDWHVTATFAGDGLDGVGLLVDFVAAEARLRAVVGRLHHTDLNECPAMRGLNPSAEHVARVIFELMAEMRRCAPICTGSRSPKPRVAWRRLSGIDCRRPRRPIARWSAR